MHQNFERELRTLICVVHPKYKIHIYIHVIYTQTSYCTTSPSRAQYNLPTSG